MEDSRAGDEVDGQLGTLSRYRQDEGERLAEGREKLGVPLENGRPGTFARHHCGARRDSAPGQQTAEQEGQKRCPHAVRRAVSMSLPVAHGRNVGRTCKQT